jgi:hypothetical protein
MQPRKVYFFDMHKGKPVGIPNVPAWVCDVCRYREYDDIALSDMLMAFGRQQPSRPEPRKPDHSSGGTRPLPPTERGKKALTLQEGERSRPTGFILA